MSDRRSDLAYRYLADQFRMIGSLTQWGRILIGMQSGNGTMIMVGVSVGGGTGVDVGTNGVNVLLMDE